MTGAGLSRADAAALVAALPQLLAAQPEWGWYLARACRAGRIAGPAPAPLSPWLQLDALSGEPPAEARLREALAAAAATCPGAGARDALLWQAGHLLPPAWATVLDELQTPGAQAYGANAAFADLAVADPARAAHRIAEALRLRPTAAVTIDLLYTALVALADAGRQVPPAIAGCRTRLEEADRTLIDEAERYAGRLRLSARQDPAAAGRLAEEAVEWVGVEAVTFGLWAVLARHPDPRALAERLRKAAPFEPRGPLASLKARVGLTDGLEIESDALQLERGIQEESVDGRSAWPACWRLLGAAVMLQATGAVERLLALGPPRWAVELATWRELRGSPPAVGVAIRRYLENDVPASALLAPPPPPWADLPPALFAARLALLADPAIPIPSGFVWRDQGTP